VSVTVYSAPPADEYEDEGTVLQAGYYDPYEHDWQLQEALRERRRRRVATQVRLYAEQSEEHPNVKPYGIGIVQDERDVELARGVSEYRFSDVARHIEPETVRFSCESAPGTVQVLEQSFEYDRVTAEAVLMKYIDKGITVELENGARVTGLLLATDEDPGRLVLGTSGGATEIVDRAKVSRILLSALPEGLIARPTLAWLVDTRRGGKSRVKVAYRTRGLVWEAGYTALLSSDEKTLALSGVATIGNASGARYEDARLKLVAGEVNLVDPPELLEDASREVGGAMMLLCADEGEGEQGFEEKSFFEYHMYTLGRRCTLGDNEVKQIELFEHAPRVPVRKTYVYYGLLLPRHREELGVYHDPGRDLDVKCNSKVDVYLHFDNEQAAGLGIPLPAGLVRLHKRDPADGQEEFVGEDEITHTPKGEEVTLRLGSALDVVGERRQTGFSCDMHGRWMKETIKIVLRNHKPGPVEVTVKENMYRWVNWEIIECSGPWSRETPLLPGRRTGLPPLWHRILVHNAGTDKITLSFRKTPLSDAVAEFSRRTGTEISFDAPPDRLGEPITLELKDAPLAEALEAIALRARMWAGYLDGRIILTLDKEKLLSKPDNRWSFVPEWKRVVKAATAGRNVDFEFAETPLREAVEFLGRLTGVVFEFDPELDAGQLTMPITLKVRGMSAAPSIHWILRLAELDCYASGGVLVITTAEKAHRRLVSVVEYDVSRLGGNPANIAELIMSTVEPDSWEAAWGNSIEERGGRLVVVQTLHVHQQIGDFLAWLRSGLDSRTVVFPVSVPADGEKKITYTVLYTW
jgi:hypothetical protein